MGDGSAFPEFWEWDKDGNIVEEPGKHVAFTTIPTKMYGEKPAVILHIGKEDRTVPLWDTALGNRFRDEIERRPEGDLTVGERVLIERGDMVEGANGHTYRAYKVRFPDAPARSAKEILGAKEAGEPERAAEKDAGTTAGGGDSDIPFRPAP